jgi:hypothetical protein
VEGKLRVVSQQYLGSAEEIAARMDETRPAGVVRTQHRLTLHEFPLEPVAPEVHGP